jgi:hypothetical protein
MSFEVFVQAFEHGEPAGISIARVKEIFAPFLTEHGPGHWRLHYDDENYCDVRFGPLENDGEILHHLTVFRPCADDRLWEALAAVLKLGNVALYFPGCHAPLVAFESVAQHLPNEMIEALGEPVCVSNGQDI